MEKAGALLGDLGPYRRRGSNGKKPESTTDPTKPKGPALRRPENKSPAMV